MVCVSNICMIYDSDRVLIGKKLIKVFKKFFKEFDIVMFCKSDLIF